jgi:hypothetical protein
MMPGTADTDPLEKVPAPALAGKGEAPVPAVVELEPATTVCGEAEWLDTA